MTPFNAYDGFLHTRGGASYCHVVQRSSSERKSEALDRAGGCVDGLVLEAVKQLIRTLYSVRLV